MLADTAHRLWKTHAPLTLSALIMASLTLFFIIGAFTDPRVITGSPAWLKPIKFGVSITLYNLTLAWLLGFIQGRRRLVGFLGWVVVITLAIEIVVIITQVIRGTSSHFNVSTPFDSMMWIAMGSAIAVLWLANLAIAVLLILQKFDNPAFAWAVRLGVILTVIGMGLGFLMTSPSAQQLAQVSAGGAASIIGAHTVGLADGGAGLPLVGWSTEAGDLRIPHFVGMHALQLIPFAGWLIASRRDWLMRQRVALVVILSAFYLGVTMLLTTQALRAQPLMRPDALTLGLFATLVVAAGVAARLVMRHAKLSAPAQESYV